jgi:HK97 family phage major capsid protein
MATPTIESVQRIENRAEQLRDQIESYLLECRAHGGDELDTTQTAKYRAMTKDLRGLERRAAHEKSELARVGSYPPGLAAVVNREARTINSAGRLSPLDLPMEELRRLHGAVERGQSASYEKRFSSADALLPPELFPYPTAAQHESRLLDRLPGYQVTLPSIEYVQHTSTTGAASSVGEGQLKPEVTLNVTKLIVPVVKLAAHLALSREIYSDWDAFSNYALQELQRQVIDVENLQLLSGDGTGTDMTGFFNTPGILVHDCSLDTGTGDTVWDSVEKSIAELRTGSALAEPDIAIFNPTDWSTIRRVKDAYQRYLVAPDPSDDQVNQCWGVPVLTTTQCPSGHGLLIDSSKFGRVAIREPMAMYFGFANDDAIRNLLRWIAEERLVLTVERPAAVLAIKSLPAPTSADAPAKSTAKR